MNQQQIARLLEVVNTRGLTLLFHGGDGFEPIGYIDSGRIAHVGKSEKIELCSADSRNFFVAESAFPSEAGV